MLNRLIASFIGIYLILTYSSALAQSDRITEPAVMQESFDNLLLLGLAQAGKRMIAVGEQGVILFSDNQGESWQQAQVPSSVLLTAVHFLIIKTAGQWVMMAWCCPHRMLAKHGNYSYRPSR